MGDEAHALIPFGCAKWMRMQSHAAQRETIKWSKTVMALTTLRPGGSDALEEYLSVVGPLMEAAAAKIIMCSELGRAISSSDPPQYVSIVEYADDAAISAVFKDPRYQSLSDVLARAFLRYDVFVLKDDV